ncbi:hypothetical protein [Ruegeria sp. HKCCD8929]|uniref:hypothetical protein n=1 Tax=Ruegeria sp. HKCCD8929 TaxID=2683006 RepID=UPI0014877008|nr:hypothetical protein [Ruegeria sp. HKCCD8929]
MGVGEAIALLAFGALVVLIVVLKEKRLADPNRTDTIYVSQMRDVCSLKDGPVSAALFRQSGNLYRDLGLFEHWREAMKEIEKSMRRAKIESVFVQSNDANRFEVIRLHHSHGGKAEGKKLGGAVIASEA